MTNYEFRYQVLNFENRWVSVGPNVTISTIEILRHIYIKGLAYSIMT